MKSQEGPLIRRRARQLEHAKSKPQITPEPWLRAPSVLWVHRKRNLTTDIAAAVLNRPDDENRRFRPLVSFRCYLPLAGPVIWGSYKTVRSTTMDADTAPLQAKVQEVTFTWLVPLGKAQQPRPAFIWIWPPLSASYPKGERRHYDYKPRPCKR